MTRQQRGTGYVAALVARLGGEVTITNEEAARAGDLVIDYDQLRLQTRISLKPVELVGEIVTAEPQSIEPPRTKKVKYVDAQGWNAAVIVDQVHQCESWQLRRGADGRKYCAACGEPQILTAGGWITAPIEALHQCDPEQALEQYDGTKRCACGAYV